MSIRSIKLDDEVLNWVVTALKESHKDENKYHEEQVAVLQARYNKLQKRLFAMYEDKLDGNIDQEFYNQKSSERKREQDKIFWQIDSHKNAERSYIDDGVKLLELTQHAVILYEKQTMQGKRRILNYVLSNSIWKDGHLHPSYRQPFDIIAETNISYQKEKVFFPEKNDLRPLWLPLANSFRNKSMAIKETTMQALCAITCKAVAHSIIPEYQP